MNYYLGIDVGTGSARAGLFDQHGQLLATAKHNIHLYHPQPAWAEQSTTNIWQAVVDSVRHVIQHSKVASKHIKGIGFDATCSLAIGDAHGKPLDLGHGHDVIVWMDQRATAEATQCTATASQPLQYVGGRMSPEMQMPKLRWLKTHRPDLWQNLGHAWDLSDWLTWRATGNNARSTCTLTCKWGFMPHHESSWDMAFLHQIDLIDVLERAALPSSASPVGAAIAPLNHEAAHELGLSTDCLVASGMIDAHAGALASFAAIPQSDYPNSLGLVAGTSNCHMAMHHNAQPIHGIWGPYQGVVIPDWWLNEGGQTASGALLQYLVEQLRGSDEFAPNPHDQVADAILNQLNKHGDPAPDLHILPDFLGNRAPLAEPRYRGVISGLGLNTARDNFLQQYWAAACAIAYGTRLIIEHLNQADYNISQIILTGGHAKSALLRSLYADACQTDLLLPDSPEPVLLGAAITAAAAHRGDLSQACADMRPHLQRQVSNTAHQALHNTRYERYCQLYQDYAQRWNHV